MVHFVCAIVLIVAALFSTCCGVYKNAQKTHPRSKHGKRIKSTREFFYFLNISVVQISTHREIKINKIISCTCVQTINVECTYNNGYNWFIFQKHWKRVLRNSKKASLRNKNIIHIWYIFNQSSTNWRMVMGYRIFDDISFAFLAVNRHICAHKVTRPKYEILLSILSNR